MKNITRLILLPALFFHLICLGAVTIEFNLVHPQNFIFNRQINDWVKKGNPIEKFQLPENYRLTSDTYENETNYYLLELKPAMTITQFWAVEKLGVDQPIRELIRFSE